MFDLMPFDKKYRGLESYFDDLEKNFFKDTHLAEFRTDILDKGDRYVLQAELPGFTKEDIKIDIDGQMLTIYAHHDTQNEETKNNYVRKERRYGSYSRRFDISNINDQEITAQYNNGILELNLPKVHHQKPETRKIEIK